MCCCNSKAPKRYWDSTEKKARKDAEEVHKKEEHGEQKKNLKGEMPYLKRKKRKTEAGRKKGISGVRRLHREVPLTTVLGAIILEICWTLAIHQLFNL